MRSISFKALAIAVVIGVVASAVFGFVLLFLISMFYGITTAAEARSLMATSPGAIASIYIYNTVVHLVVGYVAAAIAKRAELLHGVLSCVPFVLIGAYNIASGVAPEFDARNLILTVAAPLLGLAGGWFRRRRVTARQSGAAIAAD